MCDFHPMIAFCSVKPTLKKVSKYDNKFRKAIAGEGGADAGSKPKEDFRAKLKAVEKKNVMEVLESKVRSFRILALLIRHDRKIGKHFELEIGNKIVSNNPFAMPSSKSPNARGHLPDGVCFFSKRAKPRSRNGARRARRRRAHVDQVRPAPAGLHHHRSRNRSRPNSHHRRRKRKTRVRDFWGIS